MLTHLRAAFRKVIAEKPFEIDAIVVLPDHLHCVWRLPDGDSDYSGRWREIKKAASRNIGVSSNHRNERLVWQRRFWEHAIRTDDDWRVHMDYIHYNPVKHGLALRPGTGSGRVSNGAFQWDGMTNPGGAVSRIISPGLIGSEGLVDALSCALIAYLFTEKRESLVGPDDSVTRNEGWDLGTERCILSVPISKFIPSEQEIA